jgi:hypothetical protein
MKEVTVPEALQNVGSLIDEAIQKIHVWQDGPDEKRAALHELKLTRIVLELTCAHVPVINAPMIFR